MTNNRPNNPEEVSEHVERLICRRLDGELTEPQCEELDDVLAADPAARKLLSDYAQIDAIAAQSLRYDFDCAKTAVRARRLGGFRLAAAGAVLAAAAVIALSFIPDLFKPSPVAPHDLVSAPQHVTEPLSPYRGGLLQREPASQFVDYRDVGYLPQQRQQDVLRDLIGIRATNEKNQEIIYIFERNAEHTRIVPLSSDF